MPAVFFEKKDEEKIMIPERLAALREKMRALKQERISQALPVLPEPPLLPRMKRASGPTAATSYRQPKSLPEPALL